MVKAAGVVGLGGAGFPTGIKLNINLAETPMGELDPEINPELPADFKLDCEKGYILINVLASCCLCYHYKTPLQGCCRRTPQTCSIPRG